MNLASIVLANPDWLWPVVTLGGLAFLVVVISYRRSPLSGSTRLLAMGLKLLGLVLLALCLLEPMWTGESPKKGANDLVVLADNSRGLSVTAPGGDESAGSAMASLLRGSEGTLPDWLDALTDTFRLQTYTFDARLRRSADFSELDFSGDASALLTAVRSLRERYDQRPLAGILLFSDGNATDADLLERVTRELGESKAPVFAVVAGNSFDEGSDLGVGNVEIAQSPFEDAPVTITADVNGEGMAGREVQLIVANEKGEEIIRETARFGTDTSKGDRQHQRIRVRVPAVKPGVSFFNLIAVETAEAEFWNDPDRLQKQSKELTLQNNRQLVAVDRGRGPYRILYVSGRPNWEYKFLRRSVERDTEVQLVALIRIAKREPKFEWRGREGESSNPLFRGFESDIPEETKRYDEPVMIRLNTKDAEELRDGFPKDEKELFGEYRAIILDDVEKDFFTAEQLNLIERFVATRGGTVVMLGGQESFQQGDWNNSPVSRLLPVYLDRISRTGPAHNAVYNLSREGWLEPWVRLRAKQDEEETRLAYMPELFAINQVQAIKPGASVFATVTDSQQRQHPAIVAQRFGEGRSAAVTVGDFWRWGMQDAEQQADMAKAWRQMLRWMVVDVPDRLEIETRREAEGANPVIRFAVRVRDQSFRVQDDASVRIEVTGPGGGEPAELFAEPSLEEGGLFETAYYPSDAGAYTAKAIVRDGEGTLLGEKETGWALNPVADEFRSLEPNRELLRSLADASGGKVLELEDVKEFVESLPNLEAPVTEVWSRPLWHAPYLFLLALLCFAGEWGLRRWKGGAL